MNVKKRVTGVFAVDVDGTLITDDGNITSEVYLALEKAVSAGWEVVVASGRTFYAAKPIFTRLPFLRYAVLSTGACIMDVRESRVLHLETLSSDIVRTVLGVIRGKGGIPALYDTDMLDQKVYYDSIDGACEFFTWYVTDDPRCVRVNDIMDYAGDTLQIGMIAGRDIVFSICEALEESPVRAMALPFESAHFGGKNQEYWFCQIVAEHSSKISALKRIASLLDMPEGRLVAVGDNFNDIDMISQADVGVAMGNAPEEIRCLAREVVG
ncbi:HAD hydrolase family protein [Candidatus Latescibacterota bacterium]